MLALQPFFQRPDRAFHPSSLTQRFGRRAMVKAHQDVRALEILEEKARAVWQSEADREERVFLDDLRSSAGLLASPASAGGES